MTDANMFQSDTASGPNPMSTRNNLHKARRLQPSELVYQPKAFPMVGRLNRQLFLK